MVTPLDFEKDIVELEAKLEGLRHFSGSKELSLNKEIEALQKKYFKLLESIYRNLTPWQKVLVARHPERPHFSDFCKHLFTEFQELCGDRLFADDPAIVGGLARFNDIPVMVLGHEKGKDIESRLKHNFGMPKPEGYRKAIRLMEMANHFRLPLITFIDTAGAHPGLEAEERGQAEAIARSIETMTNLEVPVLSIITGEGGSGGAIAIAVGNEVIMLEHAIYSVVSPEGCASILWRTADKKMDAASAQKFTAQDLLKLGVIDQILPEPIGGAHRHARLVMDQVKTYVEAFLKKYQATSPDKLRQGRQEKFLAMGKQGL